MVFIFSHCGMLCLCVHRCVYMKQDICENLASGSCHRNPDKIIMVIGYSILLKHNYDCCTFKHSPNSFSHNTMFMFNHPDTMPEKQEFRLQWLKLLISCHHPYIVCLLPPHLNVFWHPCHSYIFIYVREIIFALVSLVFLLYQIF